MYITLRLLLLVSFLIHPLLESQACMGSAASPAEEVSSTPRTRLILSLDGGGVRGVLPAKLLNWLEEGLEADLKARFPHAPSPDIRIGDCFDLIAGTSTGGIIALTLRTPDRVTQRPKFKTVTPLSLYQTSSVDIFPKKGLLSGWFSAKFDSEALKRICRENFGELSLHDLPKPTLITAYDIHQEDLFLFKSWEAKTTPSMRFKIKDVAVATSSAPTYLPAMVVVAEADGVNKPVTHTLVDGGVSANNPALQAYIEAQELYPRDKLHIISLGCGATKNFTLESKANGGKLSWAGDISSVLMNTTSSITHTQMAQLTRLRGDLYTRVQFDLDQHVKHLDDATSENINNLIGYAKREIRDPHSEIHKIKEALLSYYAARDYYVHYDLIEEIHSQLRTSQDIDLSRRHLDERSLWEVGHFIRTKDLKITGLNLSHNSLTPTTLQWIGTFRDLTYLNLNNTDLTESGLKYLQRAGVPASQITLKARENGRLGEIDAHALVHYLSGYQGLELDAPLNLKIGGYYAQQRDYRKAERFYQDDVVENQLALAELYFIATGEFTEGIEKGFRICRDLAQRGNAEAQYMMGHLFAKPDEEILSYLRSHNEITPNDEENYKSNKSFSTKAAHWYRLAADQRHKSAANALGNFYYEEKIAAPIPGGGARDERYQLRAALKYYLIAKEAGSTSVDRFIAEIQEKLQAYKG